jgi:hypothetical protein
VTVVVNIEAVGLICQYHFHQCFIFIFIYVLLSPEAEPTKSNAVLEIGDVGEKVLQFFVI